MSRSPPGQAYGYATHSAVAANYYYDDQEGYVGDYAESDAASERSHLIPSNTTEIFRKKQVLAAQVVPPHEHYRQNIFIPPNYYYEAVPAAVPQQVRRPAVPTAYRRHIPLVEERARYYTAAPLEEGFRDTVVYSSPHIATVRRPSLPQPTSTTISRPAVRRHPVTVRTPKYVRRPPVSNIYKKPSTLCMPLACQLDPAVNRRAHKNADEVNCNPQVYTQQPQPPKSLARTHSVPMQSNPVEQQVTHTASYPRNLHMTQSDVDAVLARYETVFEGEVIESGSDKCESTSSKSSIDGRISKTKLAVNMQPKVPPSLKQNQERVLNKTERIESAKTNNSKTRMNTPPHVDHLEVEEITTEVLDSMLTELMTSGGENKVNHQNQNMKNGAPTTGKGEYCEKTNTTSTTDSKHSKTDGNQISYNYQDLSQNMSQRVNTYQKCEGKNQSNYTASPRQEVPPAPRLNINTPRAEGPSTTENTPKQGTPSTPYSKMGDENGVTELHRSKSYIVNLIDRALSKELGTSPTNERYPATSKGSEQLHTRKAMGLMNKHLDKMDKGLCLEITQTLTDSLISNATAPISDQEAKRETTCSCNVHDEPLYIKQLRQLRWGHLRHIQREVRRLEDLERFLDSCSSGMLK